MLEQRDRTVIDCSPKTETLGERTPVLVSGLPGKMATLVAEDLAGRNGYEVFPIGISSRRHSGETVRVGNQEVRLMDYLPFDIQPGVIAVDYTNSKNALINAIHYTSLREPFVMGTTVSTPDFERIKEVVRESEISAVVAPNMATEIVALQEEFKELQENRPNAFAGWQMTIRESHQATKKGVSGTAVAFKEQLEALGAVLDGEIDMIRNPEIQRSLGIRNLEAHGYHWISLTGLNRETKEYVTVIEGRQPYVDGTIMAMDFLKRRLKEGSRGEVFTMGDVIAERRQNG